MKVNGNGKPERLALFAQTDSELRFVSDWPIVGLP